MASTAIPRSSLREESALRLYCLPYAGGGAAVYHRWRSAMPALVDLVPLTLPGHDGRLREPPCTDLRRLAADLAAEMAAANDRPYVVMGYSMGAWLAFEVVRELRQRSQTRSARLPELLVVAASSAPHAKSLETPLHPLQDAEFVATVERRYGGIPAAVRNSHELMQLLLPALRADFQMVETYDYVEEPALETPIFAVGGTEDASLSAAQLGEWRRHTSGEYSLRLFPGGHFFLFDPTSQLETSPALRAIVARLERCMAREHGDSKSPG